MKLWLIKRLEPVKYDEFGAKVVAAHDEASARRIAAINWGDEGKNAWLLDRRSQVTEIGLAKDPEHEQVILEDFNAG